MPGDEAQPPASTPAWHEVFTHDVRQHGREPDVRFSLANERTFLAWIRTSLALVGGGFAIEKLVPEVSGATALALTLMSLGLALSLLSYRRWALSEIALRTGNPLPTTRVTLLLVIGVFIAGAAAVALVIAG